MESNITLLYYTNTTWDTDNFKIKINYITK